MPSDLRLLAVIPARGGSKGLPRKNVKLLAGKPLIAWTIEAAQAAESIDRVILSTDDPEIAEVGRRFGCEVPFMRPADLAGDTSRQADVVSHAVRCAATGESERYDAVLCLQPTSPLRKPHHIDEAVREFVRSGADSLISLKYQDYPPWWMFVVDGGRIRPAFAYREGVNVFDLVRQQFPPVYRPNGAIYLTRMDYLVRTGRLVNIEDCAYYLMPDEDSISIDTAVHFATVEAMVRLASPATEQERGPRSS